LSLTLHIDIGQEDQNRLIDRARRAGLSLDDYVQQLLREMASNDARSVRLLSRDERNRILAAQAEDAAPLYEADLSKPVAFRELTAFTALDGDPIHDIAD
jgi:hypothetical protein